MAVSNATIGAIRFGYGFHPDQPAPDNPDALMAALRAGQTAPLLFDVPGSDDRRALLDEMIRLRKAKDKEGRRKAIRKMRIEALRDVARRVHQRALSPHGFYERVAGFWADHFTVAGKNPGQLYFMPVFEPEALRPHIMGRFEDMLTAVAQHPAMLIYLDQVESFGPASRAGKRLGRGLNENLAREILELHTIGVGGPYTQRDVREFAELLTGYGTRRGYASFRFVRRRAEPGPETVLGKTYGGDPARAEHAVALFRDLARHPATARHLARKLAVHFVADEPDPDLVAHIAGAWQRSGADLPTVYAALVEHPAAWRDFGAKVKRPVELVASTLRALGLDARAAAMRIDQRPRAIFQALRTLNQPMFKAPGPDGWPEEAEAWITPQGLAARLQYASRAAQLITRARDLDPRRFAEATLRDTIRPDTAFAVRAAPDRWEGIAYVLASPEFNRR